MSALNVEPTRVGLWTSLASLFASSSTLICCAIPALLVALGAGATLATLATMFPQLIWISEHKTGLFVLAGLMLAVSVRTQWRDRHARCPTNGASAIACAKTRKTAAAIAVSSVLVYTVGAWFAFILPRLAE